MKKGEESYLGRPLPPMKMSRYFSWLFNESKKKAKAGILKLTKVFCHYVSD